MLSALRGKRSSVKRSVYDRLNQAKRALFALYAYYNHPSGNVEPSNEDRAVTETLVEAGDLLGIRVIDHVVFTHREHISFIERGYI